METEKRSSRNKKQTKNILNFIACVTNSCAVFICSINRKNYAQNPHTHHSQNNFPQINHCLNSFYKNQKIRYFRFLCTIISCTESIVFFSKSVSVAVV